MSKKRIGAIDRLLDKVEGEMRNNVLQYFFDQTMKKMEADGLIPLLNPPLTKQTDE